MNRIVLLTGATGFVGRQVYKSLLNLGIKVRVVVRDGKAAEVEPSEYLESIVATKDLFSESDTWWAQVCNGVDIVIHVAWYAEPGKYLDSPKNLDCLIGTLALAKGAAKAKVRRFIGIGTCFEYDLTDGHLSIDTQLKPLTPYAAAKAATFMALSKWRPTQEMEFSWCRLFYLFGEGEDQRRFLPYLRARLAKGKAAELGSGDQVRDYLDVREAGQMISSLALSDTTGSVNICSETPVTIRQLAEEVADEYGRRDLLLFGAKKVSELDPSCVVGIR
jgi:dTDP-6-deoxy-L-talose 4-dehydrogenase (NAD+)